MIGEPFDAAAPNAIVAEPLPRVPVPMVGAPGRVAGVTDAMPEGELVPTPLVAVTEHIYGVPFTKPPTTIGDVGPEFTCVPGVQLAV